ncbi:hypothetical protein X777_13179, partial [Ooceraea biroi]
ILNESFPDRWIGRGGRISWPARSPDLMPLDFFLWGHLKNEVATVRGNTLLYIIFLYYTKFIIYTIYRSR